MHRQYVVLQKDKQNFILWLLKHQLVIIKFYEMFNHITRLSYIFKNCTLNNFENKRKIIITILNVRI